ncbi:hypothetical protein [Bacillus sp. NPDC094106]|uniref:hypothetical protein n=1 Tax=Bacillus sp. NPDC094106 TaxID=3363949 RepID=UPI00380C741E
MNTLFLIAKIYLLIGFLTLIGGIIHNSISLKERPDFTFGETKFVEIVKVYCISIFAWPVAIACAIIGYTRDGWI